MDKKLMDAGIKVRREVLGDEYVDRSMKERGRVQQAVPRRSSASNAGVSRGRRDPLAPREQQPDLGMTAATGRMQEFELHFRGAKRNGLTDEELRAVLIQIATTAVFQSALDCFRRPRRCSRKTRSDRADRRRSRSPGAAGGPAPARPIRSNPCA